MLILSRRAEESIFLDLAESVDPKMTVGELFAERIVTELVKANLLQDDSDVKCRAMNVPRNNDTLKQSVKTKT